jgi:hypothetical protein
MLAGTNKSRENEKSKQQIKTYTAGANQAARPNRMGMKGSWQQKSELDAETGA